jgi:hypothetical protein
MKAAGVLACALAGAVQTHAQHLQTYGYETRLFHCTPGSSQQQWKVINGRARQRRTDLCLTIDSCETPSTADDTAVMEHCGKGCWADTMINRVSQQWEIPSATDGAGKVRSRATLDLGSEEQEPLCLSYGTPSTGVDDPRVLMKPCDNATDWRYEAITSAGDTDYHLLQIVFPPGVDNSTACTGGPPCCLGTSNLVRSAGLHAMLAQFLAAAALPLGAILGVVAAPVRQDTIAAMNAFGAGALIFSLSVQIYGEILLSFSDRTAGAVQVALSVGCTIIGAVLYNYSAYKLGETVKPFKPGVQGVAGASLQSDGGLEAPLLSSADAAASNEAEDSSDTDDEADNQDDAERPNDEQTDDTAIRSSGSPLSVLAAERHLAGLLWLSCWVDLVPQAVLFGLLAGERVLHVSLVIACALANLPQAFSSAVRKQNQIHMFGSREWQ